MWPPFTRICNKNYCRSGPSGLEQRVTLWVDTKVSEEHSDSKFRAVDGTLVSTGKSTWCFSAEHHPHLHLRENQVSHMGKAVKFMCLWSTCCQQSPVMGPEAEVCCHCWISWSHSEVYAVILLKAFCLWNIRIYFMSLNLILYALMIRLSKWFKTIESTKVTLNWRSSCVDKRVCVLNSLSDQFRLPVLIF